MKYLYSWLKEHYPSIPAIDQLQDMLIKIGHDIESVVPITYPDLVVAEILAVEKHPNADRLSLVKINDGTTEHDIVCGAPNLVLGQKVVYAPVGASLPCGITLRAAAIRGVTSDGMLLAEDEIGTGQSHDGLLPVAVETKAGTPAVDILPPDAVITLDITSDRGDVLSHFGLARDIAAAHEQKQLKPRFLTPNYQDETATVATIAAIQADARALSLGLVTSDKPCQTPLYIMARLQLLGQNCINLPTDLTNYLLFEYGQPLHAYDAHRLPESKQFSVRRGKNGESFSGLNGKTYALSPQALVIAVNDQPVALAGVLGGETTKVTEKTTTILFESAHFYPKPIRLMARGLNCLTESAIRWERGVDFSLMHDVLGHVQALYSQLTDGKAAKPVVIQNSPTNETPQATLAWAALNKTIGSPFDPDHIRTILESLGCTVSDSDDGIQITPPAWRPDLAITEDYYEEIVRMVGLDTLTKKPLSASVPQWKRSKWWREEYLKDILVALGGFEISSYPFMSDQELQFFPSTEPAIELTTPAIENKQWMRTSLIPGILQAIATNPETPSMVLFEIGKIYLPKQEVDILCIGGASSNQAELDDWWKNLFERLHFPVSSWMSRVQTIDDNIKQNYKIRKTFVSVLTLPVTDLFNGKSFENPTVTIPDLDEISYSPISKYQASRRDVAFVVDQSITPERVIQDLQGLNKSIVAVELFDTYADSKLGDNNYSLAFHVVYQATDKTLTNDEIQALHSEVETYIQEHYHATIR